MSNEEDEFENEPLVHVSTDQYKRSISLHIHMHRPMTPREFMSELALIVADYQDTPEELFIEAEIETPH